MTLYGYLSILVELFQCGFIVSAITPLIRVYSEKSLPADFVRIGIAAVAAAGLFQNGVLVSYHQIDLYRPVPDGLLYSQALRVVAFSYLAHVLFLKRRSRLR